MHSQHLKKADPLNKWQQKYWQQSPSKEKGL